MPMSVSILHSFHMSCKSKNLSSYVGLSVPMLCIWFMLEAMMPASICVQSDVRNHDVIYITCIQSYVFGLKKMFHVFLSSSNFTNISAPIIENW